MDEAHQVKGTPDKIDLEALCNRTNLKDREREILQYRFGWKDNRSHTLAELGRRYKVTATRIRQIEQKAILRMKLQLMKERDKEE